MSLSIRWRLAAGIVLAFVATLAVIFVTVQFALQRILTDNLDDDLTQDARAVVAYTTLVGIEDQTRLQGYVREKAIITEGNTPSITVIRDLDGRALVSTERVQEENLALTIEELKDVLAGKVFKWTVDLPGEKEYRVRTQSLAVGAETLGVVQVAQVTKAVVDPVNTLLAILAAEGVVAAFLVAAAAIWLSRGTVQPLQRVIDVAAEIQASDLRRRIQATGQPAEVQKLADTFDAMLERLERAFQEQRNFVSDVSHELRTPLTALKGTIDVMLMDSAIDPGTRDQFERMSAEVSRLIRLTSNLLYMASAEAGRDPDRRPTELDVVCLEVLRQSRDLRHDVKLSLGHEDQVSVMGDRDQIRQMVLNLVENALKYTPAGGEVTLSVSKDGRNAEVQVADTGPGIPADVLPNIFQRFYRGQQRGMMGGTGLGLAISDRIARSHGGAISVESRVGKGSTFTVTLPLAEDSSSDGVTGAS